MFYQHRMAFKKIKSGHSVITSHLCLISEFVTMVMAYPKASQQIIIFSLGLAVQTAVQPTHW